MQLLFFEIDGERYGIFQRSWPEYLFVRICIGGGEMMMKY